MPPLSARVSPSSSQSQTTKVCDSERPRLRATEIDQTPSPSAAAADRAAGALRSATADRSRRAKKRVRKRPRESSAEGRLRGAALTAGKRLWGRRWAGQRAA